MQAKEIRTPIQKVYSNLDYFQFCELMELDPRTSEKYWAAFQELSKSLAVFDDQRLEKLFNYGNQT